MAFIKTLNLTHFRCYDTTKLDHLSSGLIVLHGANGAGKTNILEAISLLTPGRGIRGARVNEIQQNTIDTPWAISATLTHAYGETKIGTGRDPHKDNKRIIRINGENARGQNALAEHLSCIWLTPQMDRLFLDSSRERRKFLDRMIYNFDPAHAGRITRYENTMRQRSKLLTDKNTPADPAWVTGLEKQMAETGVAIAAARLDFVERLSQAAKQHQTPHFPYSHLNAKGTVEELLGRAPALEVEDLYLYQLQQSRAKDAITGGAATGPHKSDLAVTYADKNMAADQCSTGEQKALLIGIILAHAHLIEAERGHPPILLLDEVAAHLDESRRAALYTILQDLNAQTWLTGTDKSLFNAIENTAQFFEIKDSQIFTKPRAVA